MHAQCGRGWAGRCAASRTKRCRCKCGGANHGRLGREAGARRSHANYRVLSRGETAIVIRDIGPWDLHPTVTNDANHVVASLASELRGRRLFYFDSEGQFAELLVRDGVFAGFAPATPSALEPVEEAVTR